eukprot:4800703-Karenia_brevis.AAC.1
MNETRATGLRTLCASGRSAGLRTQHSPVEDSDHRIWSIPVVGIVDDDKCPDLISSSSESDAEAED